MRNFSQHHRLVKLPKRYFYNYNILKSKYWRCFQLKNENLQRMLVPCKHFFQRAKNCCCIIWPCILFIAHYITSNAICNAVPVYRCGMISRKLLVWQWWPDLSQLMICRKTTGPRPVWPWRPGPGLFWSAGRPRPVPSTTSSSWGELAGLEDDTERLPGSTMTRTTTLMSWERQAGEVGDHRSQ